MITTHLCVLCHYRTAVTHLEKVGDKAPYMHHICCGNLSDMFQAMVKS